MKSTRDPSHSPEFILGQILATVASTDEKVARLLWRADNIESRVEALEKIQAEAAGAAKKVTLWDKVGEKGALVAIGIIVTFLLTKVLGA